MKWLSSLLPNKFEKKHYILVAILVVASFLRLYNIAGTVQFLGDQGRDAMVVAKIFRELDPVFIGPVTSVGNMYLGPLYYYFMVPFLFLSFPSPMGPVYTVAMLGILTVFLMYYLGKKLLSENVALIASGLFGLSTIVAHNTRFSWNPNPAPLVSLFMMFFTYKALKKDTKYWIAVVICLSIMIQLHYMTLLSGAGFGVVWLYQLFTKIRTKKSIKKLLIATSIGALIFFISLTPLFLFDLKHDGLNRKAFLNILTAEETFVEESKEPIESAGDFIEDIKSRTELITAQIAIGEQTPVIEFATAAAILFVFLFVVYQNRKKNTNFIFGEFIIASFLITGILGTAAYKHNLYHHYISYLFPVAFFAIAIVIEYLYKKNLIGKIAVVTFLILFVQFNYQNSFKILKSQGWTIAHIQSVAQTIEDRVSEGEKYNIVLLNDTGDLNGQNYRYFLFASEKPPVPETEFGQIETLFIIDETRAYDKVVDSPVYEIVVFPNKKPVEVYQIPDGPEITVLRKNTN